MGRNYFARNIVLIIVFLTLTPIALGTSLYALISISASSADNSPQVLAASNEPFVESPKAGVSLYASLPKAQPTILTEAIEEDARTEIVKNYLRVYNSPLIHYSEDVVNLADKYNLDFRLTTAIAQQESNLCKKIPAETYNCWGWGIHSQGTLGFSSYTEALDAVSKGIREEYIDKGYTTVEDIMSKYTPLSKGSWAQGVSEFMEEMQ